MVAFHCLLAVGIKRGGTGNNITHQHSSQKEGIWCAAIEVPLLVWYLRHPLSLVLTFMSIGLMF